MRTLQKSKDKGLKLGIFIWAQLRAERLSQRLVDEWLAFPIYVVDLQVYILTHTIVLLIESGLFVNYRECHWADVPFLLIFYPEKDDASRYKNSCQFM